MMRLHSKRKSSNTAGITLASYKKLTDESGNDGRYESRLSVHHILSLPWIVRKIFWDLYPASYISGKKKT